MMELPKSEVLLARGSAKAINDRKRILYAEDDAQLRELLARALNRKGYSVVPVGDGLAALEAAREGGFDLLITDNDMPRLTGLELIARLRLTGSPLPIIVTSAISHSVEGPEHSWLGLAACLQKPFELQDLLTIISEIFARPRDFEADSSSFSLPAQFGRV